MSRVIGLCGPEGAGKSTVARLLAEHHGAEILPFAEPLKRMILALGVDPKHVFGTPAEKLEPLELFGGKSARVVLQRLGTEWGRQQIDDEFWVRAWLQRVKKAHAGVVVADDLRFANEAAAVQSLGGCIVCIVRSLNDFQRKPKHASEDFASVPASWVLINSGSLEDLRAQVNSWLSRTAEKYPSGSSLGALNDSLQRNNGARPFP